MGRSSHAGRTGAQRPPIMAIAPTAIAPTAIALAAIALSPIGCGDGMARVEGTVSLGGEAVAESDTRRCYVTFKPQSGGAVASGEVGRNGRFRLSVGATSGMPPGDYTASVRVCDVTPAAEAGGYSSSRDVSPARYAKSNTSGLVYALSPGSNEIRIEIEAE